LIFTFLSKYVSPLLLLLAIVIAFSFTIGRFDFLLGMFFGILSLFFVLPLYMFSLFLGERYLLKPFESFFPLYGLFRKVERYKFAKKQYDSWWIKTQQEFWVSLRGRRFEEELGHLFSKFGYYVSLTPTSGDQGVDIMLMKGGKNIIVQCKAHKNPVGPGIVRDLYGTLISFKADEAILASVSGFTTGVLEFVKDKPIKLISLNEILEMQKTLEK